jgi:hypothetical protein
MPIEIENESDGVVVIRVVGKLVKEDYARFTPRFEQVARERGELRVLFDMTRLEGWDAGGLWEETKFDIQHYSAIGRMAAIGDEKWHHALMSAVACQGPLLSPGRNRAGEGLVVDAGEVKT